MAANPCKMKNADAIRRILLSLLLAGLLFSPARQAAASEGLLSYEEPDSKAAYEAVLYFRYLSSPYLVQESRTIQVAHTESREKALVKALLDGPAAAGSVGRSLFPRGTRVISVLAEGDTLFVTLSSEVMGALEDENNQTGREAALLRRRLLISSLANTLTESGQYQKVQVLVFDRASADASMRLSQRFYLEDSDQIPAPVRRREEDIITPGKAAEMILGLWQQQNWGALPGFLALEPGYGNGLKKPDVQNLPVLLAFSSTPGTLSPDGKYAVVEISLEMKTIEGKTEIITNHAVRLLRQNNAWLMSLPSFMQLTLSGQP